MNPRRRRYARLRRGALWGVWCMPSPELVAHFKRTGGPMPGTEHLYRPGWLHHGPQGRPRCELRATWADAQADVDDHARNGGWVYEVRRYVGRNARAWR